MGQSKIVTLNHLSDSQLQAIVDLLRVAFDDDVLTNAMTGGVDKLKTELFLLVVRAAALEGTITVCQNTKTDQILSVAICFGPGVNFLGSEAQRALGAAEYFAKLPQETKKWLDEVNRPLSKKFIDDTIGQQAVTDSWWVLSLGTLENERRKGYATAIMRDICLKAKKGRNIVALNAIYAANVSFYINLGFRVVGSADRPSPFGTFTNNMMVWDGKTAT